MDRRIWLLLAAIALPACSPREIRFAFPPDPPMGTQIVALLQNLEVHQLFAIDLATDQTAELSVPDDVLTGRSGYEIDSLIFEASPSELGLTHTGELDRGTSPLPDMTVIRRRLSITDGAPSPVWSDAEIQAAPLQNMLAKPLVPRCPEISARTIQVGAGTDLTGIGKIDGDSALAVGKIGPTWLRIHADGTVENVPAVSGFVPISVLHASDGRIFVGGEAGKLVAAADPTLTFLPAATAPDGAALAWMDGPSAADVPFELYAMSEEGRFLRFDGAGWRSLAWLSTPIADPRISRGGVAWLGPNNAVAFPPASDGRSHTSQYGDHLIEATGSSTISTDLSDTDGKLLSSAVVPRFDRFVSRGVALSGAGELIDLKGAAKNELTARKLSSPSLIVPHESDGYWAIGQGVEIRSWSSKFGSCPQDQALKIDSPLVPLAAVVLDRVAIVVGARTDPSATTTPILILDL